MAKIEPLGGGAPIAARPSDEEYELDRLPREHPAWVKDTLSISQRARAFIAQLRPMAIRVLTFWDHAVRSLRIGNARVSIDGSGSYKLD